MAELMVIPMGGNFMAPFVNFSDQMGKPFGDPTKNEESRLRFEAGGWRQFS